MASADYIEQRLARTRLLDKYDKTLLSITPAGSLADIVESENDSMRNVVHQFFRIPSGTACEQCGCTKSRLDRCHTTSPRKDIALAALVLQVKTQGSQVNKGQWL
jgi:hypothetical protein